MRRRLQSLAVLFFSLLMFAVVWHFSVHAERTSLDLPSSQDGSSPGAAGTCADSFPTPFAVTLNGKVAAVPASPSGCADFTTSTGIYPNYTLTLKPTDNSFTVTITPVLWENGAGGGSRQTILHLEFSSTNPNLKLRSFVIGGLSVSNATLNPRYVACDLDQSDVDLYQLPVVTDNLPGDTLSTRSMCTEPTMSPQGTAVGAKGVASAVQPTPIQFADTNTVRWDIAGVSGSNPLSSPLPSVDVVVPGFPNDISPDNPSGTPPTNNLTQTFMAAQSNFLAVVVDSSSGTTNSAGSLSIPVITKSLTNDSISSPTVVDPILAITTGFTDAINTATATPQEAADGTPTSVPTNPSDPSLPSTCFDGGTSAASLFRTVWYSFTPAGAGTVTIDSANSRYDTVIGLFTGTPGNLVLVPNACNDDITATQPHRLQARLSAIPVTQGTPYFILVGEAPTPIDVQNVNGPCAPATTTPPFCVTPSTTKIGGPLSNDATLFVSVVETPSTPPAILLAPVTNTTLAFGTQQTGTTSAAQSVTITSQGDAPLKVSSITFPSGFAESDTCASPIPKGSNCKINLSFQPLVVGAASGNLTFVDNASGPAPNYPLTGTGTNPIPVVTSISPTNGVLGQPVATLTVTGTSFVAGATVSFNGTTNAGVVSNGGTTITASIPALQLAAAGTVPVLVTNPTPGGGSSNSVNFTINNPVPTVTTVSPTSALVSQAVATLTVTGTNFVAGATVNFNGTSNPGTVSNGGATITASIAASELPTAGVVPVIVTNPTPGGGASNSVNFTINNPVPVITAISPTTAPVGTAISPLTATGTGFVAGATLIFNGTSHAGTVSNNGTTLTASIASTELAASGSIGVTVSNPTPGGGGSNSISFVIDNFTVTGPSSAVTVPAGQPAIFAINFGTQGGALGSTVNFSASGLPAAATASFNPSSLPAGSASGATTLTVTTTARTLAPPFVRNLPKIQPLIFTWMAVFTLAILLADRTRRVVRTGLRLRRMGTLLALSCLLVSGCGSAGTPTGGGGGTPAGTSTITVSATSGTASRSTTVTLTVQ
jgi:hypothetical protein